MKRTYRKNNNVYEVELKKFDENTVEVVLDDKWIARLVKNEVWVTVSFGEHSPPWPGSIWCGVPWPTGLYRMAVDSYWKEYDQLGVSEKQEAVASWERERQFNDLFQKVREMIWKEEGRREFPEWTRRLFPKLRVRR